MEAVHGILYELQFADFLWGEAADHLVNYSRRGEVHVVPAEKRCYCRAGEDQENEKRKDQADDLLPIPLVQKDGNRNFFQCRADCRADRYPPLHTHAHTAELLIFLVI